MTLLWREQLSVGNDLIDSDHRHLIEIINKAEVHFKANNHRELTAVLAELAHYGKTHFDREERIARAAGYTGTAQLHAAHDRLVEELKDFRENLGTTWSEDEVARFTLFLRNWLINHVIKEDLLMRPWLAKLSPSYVPG